VLAIPVTVAPAVGPLLGGYIVQYQDWRWIFFLNVVPGIVAILAAVSFLREETQANPGKLDLRGFLLAGAGLVGVVYGLSQVGHRGFGDSEVLIFGLGGLAVLGLFTLAELRTDQPMLDVRLLTDKLFGASNFVLLVGNASIMGTFFLLPIFLQTQKGLSAFDVGLVTFPIAIGVAMMAQPAAKLYPKIGPRRMMIVGFTGNMAMTAALALINYGTADWLIGANMFVRGLFLAFLFIPLQAATFATISPEATGRASSIFSVSRQVAASFGVAILATALTSRLSFHDALLADAATRDAALSAFQDTFLFAGAVSVLGIVACFLIDDQKAAEAAGMDFAGEGAPAFALEPINDWDAA
jgi:EmrB/QacA subfamily drug resistance transporter